MGFISVSLPFSIVHTADIYFHYFAGICSIESLLWKDISMDKNQSEPILTIKEVSKAFPGVQALDKVSLEIFRGTIHGIVGENGAGKSTLMKILSGVYEKDSGEIVFDGNRIENITPIQSMKMGLSIIYQELNLVNTMTVGENIFLGRFSEMGGRKGV